MAKTRNQRRFARLVAAGGKASMAALVALPVACGDVNSPDELTSHGTVKAGRHVDPTEELFAKIDADLPFASDAGDTLEISAGYCKDGSVPSALNGKCTINGKTSASLEKSKYLNIRLAGTDGTTPAPVKISTRASDGVLLINGFEANVLESAGKNFKVYKFKAATTNVVIYGTNTTADPAVTGQQEFVIVDLSSRAGPKTVTYTALETEGTLDADLTKSDVLFVKGSSSADVALAQADGTVKVGSTIFRTASAHPASLSLMLGAGDDTYDGSKFVGYSSYSAAGVGTDLKYGVPPVKIFGQEGNDTFYSGAAIEWFVGGDGVDTVRSLGFTKGGDVYATSGGLDVTGAAVTGGGGTFSQFMDDSVATVKPEADNSGYVSMAGHVALPFYDTLRADVLDLSGWLGATTRFHGASGENVCDVGNKFNGVVCVPDANVTALGTLFGGNDWLVNSRAYRNSQDIVGLVIDATKSIVPGDKPADGSEVSIAAWPPGVHGQAIGGGTQTSGSIQLYGLAKLMNEVDDSSVATTEEYFSTYFAPRTPVTFTGDLRAETFVQSSTAFADNLKGSTSDSAAKDTVSYQLRTRPVKVDFTYYGKVDGSTSLWQEGEFGTEWADGNHTVPAQADVANLIGKPVHGEGYYVGTQTDRVFVVTEADSLDGFSNIVGGAAADWLIGSQGPNYLAGGAGSDMIEGMGGSDLIAGGAGTDLLDGGSAIVDGPIPDLDVLDYSSAVLGVKVDLANSQQSKCAGGTLDDSGELVCSTTPLFVASLSGVKDPALLAYVPSDTPEADPVNLQTAIDSKVTVGDGDYVWRFEGVKGSAFSDTLTAAVSVLGPQTTPKVGSILAGGGGNDFLYGVASTDTDEYSDLLLGEDGDDYIGVVEPVDAVDGGEGDDLIDAANTEKGLTLNATTWPDASTGWDALQPIVASTDLQLFPSYVGAPNAFPRMTSYVSSTTEGVPTYTEYTFTCGGGSDIISWSLFNTYDATATGPKDLRSCNESFFSAP
jgi:hypothetical protein